MVDIVVCSREMGTHTVPVYINTALAPLVVVMHSVPEEERLGVMVMDSTWSPGKVPDETNVRVWPATPGPMTAVQGLPVPVTPAVSRMVAAVGTMFAVPPLQSVAADCSCTATGPANITAEPARVLPEFVPGVSTMLPPTWPPPDASVLAPPVMDTAPPAPVFVPPPVSDSAPAAPPTAVPTTISMWPVVPAEDAPVESWMLPETAPLPRCVANTMSPVDSDA